MKQWFNKTYPEAIKLLGGMPDDERRARRAEDTHNEAKQKLAAAKKLQAAGLKSDDYSNDAAADLEESAA